MANAKHVCSFEWNSWDPADTPPPFPLAIFGQQGFEFIYIVPGSEGDATAREAKYLFPEATVLRSNITLLDCDRIQFRGCTLIGFAPGHL